MVPLVLLILLIIYALVITVLTFIFRCLRVSSRWAVLAAFLTFAVGTAAWVVANSHYDSSLLVNMPAVYIGEGIYQLSIQLFGDPHSAQAHYTIPWLLRTPQVFILASIIAWGLLGLIVQFLFNRRHKKASGTGKHRGLAVPKKEETPGGN